MAHHDRVSESHALLDPVGRNSCQELRPRFFQCPFRERGVIPKMVLHLLPPTTLSISYRLLTPSVLPTPTNCFFCPTTRPYQFNVTQLLTTHKLMLFLPTLYCFACFFKISIYVVTGSLSVEGGFSFDRGNSDGRTLFSNDPSRQSRGFDSSCGAVGTCIFINGDCSWRALIPQVRVRSIIHFFSGKATFHTCFALHAFKGKANEDNEFATAERCDK